LLWLRRENAELAMERDDAAIFVGVDLFGHGHDHTAGHDHGTVHEGGHDHDHGAKGEPGHHDHDPHQRH
jgi:hypothetical protein